MSKKTLFMLLARFLRGSQGQRATHQAQQMVRNPQLQKGLAALIRRLGGRR
jgi:hypothetical protein